MSDSLSELERAVLGVISLYQPCSGYAIRKVFERSLSAHWRGSSGAIYPLLRRLEERSVIKSVRQPGDGRSTRAYRLTRTGKARLVRWLRAPLPDGSELVTMDPLRVRVRFMNVLTEKERHAMVRDARVKLREHLGIIAELAEEDRREVEMLRYLSHRNAMLSIQAQLTWLDEVEAVLRASPGLASA